MEPVSAGRGSAHVVAVGLGVTWKDVGGYASLAEVLSHDSDGNAVEGLVVSLDAHDNIVVNADGPQTVIGLLGVSGMVVVRTPRATLVAPVAEAERVKELVAHVTALAGPRFA